MHLVFRESHFTHLFLYPNRKRRSGKHRKKMTRRRRRDPRSLDQLHARPVHTHIQERENVPRRSQAECPRMFCFLGTHAFRTLTFRFDNTCKIWRIGFDIKSTILCTVLYKQYSSTVFTKLPYRSYSSTDALWLQVTVTAISFRWVVHLLDPGCPPERPVGARGGKLALA